MADWNLTPEEWSGARGQKLRLQSSPFSLSSPRADGYGGRLLAVAIVELGDADAVWQRFWQTSSTLREIVEFGDHDEDRNAGWQGRSDAARLLMLQFSIGLMMLDFLIKPARSLNYDRQPAAENLLPQLYAAVREMGAIDQLNGKFWSEAVRHLAIRRTIWLRGDAASTGVVLSPEVTPRFTDFIRALAGDTENLLLLIHSAHRNHVDRETITASLNDAGIDIQAEIATAETLLALSPKALALDGLQLKALRELMLVGQG